MISAIKGLFINNKKAQDSIHESGVMVFNCLRLSSKFTLDYIEISLEERSVPTGYEFYFFNYHPYTMPWLETSLLKALDGAVITMVLEVLPGDPFVMCPRNHFDYYCVLDPSLKSKKRNVIAFPRPLDVAEVFPYLEKTVPVIGSFGFATRGKGFQHVVDAVNKEFEKAVIKINIPFGSFVPDSEDYSRILSEICKSKANEGIEVIVTHDYLSKSDLIKWCSQNTLNCFLYDRSMPGLAATTDQAIVSGRPLAVSRNDTFRHILSYLPPYPDWSLVRSINESSSIVAKIKEDWSPEKFCQIFEGIVEKMAKRDRTGIFRGSVFILPMKRNRMWDKVKRTTSKFRRRFSISNIFKSIFNNTKKRYEKLV